MIFRPHLFPLRFQIECINVFSVYLRPVLLWYLSKSCIMYYFRQLWFPGWGKSINFQFFEHLFELWYCYLVVLEKLLLWCQFEWTFIFRRWRIFCNFNWLFFFFFLRPLVGIRIKLCIIILIFFFLLLNLFWLFLFFFYLYF